MVKTDFVCIECERGRYDSTTDNQFAFFWLAINSELENLIKIAQFITAECNTNGLKAVR